jgi:hypothetical protein
MDVELPGSIDAAGLPRIEYLNLMMLDFSRLASIRVMKLCNAVY